MRSTQVDGIKIPLTQDNKIRYHFYRNSPPLIMVGAIAKIVRVSREWVDLHFTPPAGFAMENKNKIKVTLTQKIKKINFISWDETSHFYRDNR